MFRLVLLFSLALAACVTCADELPKPGPFAEEHYWPLSGKSTPDVPVKSSFGPRLLRSEDFRYQFHRGLDLAATPGTPVYAIADGEVRIAGKHPSYTLPLVQLVHAKPADGENADPGVYYSMYMSLSEPKVEKGDQVKRGQLIGLTGLSVNGFEHLDFEIRDGGTSQAFAIHPLMVLPYDNATPPSVKIRKVTKTRTGSSLEILVQVPSREADFNRLEVRLYDRDEVVDERVLDFTQWNRRFPATDRDSDPLEQPVVEGFDISPSYHRGDDDLYEWNFIVADLKPVGGLRRPQFKVTAIDALGKSSEAVAR